MSRNTGVLDVLSDGEIGEMMLRRGAKLQSDSNRMFVGVWLYVTYGVYGLRSLEYGVLGST